jgi:hypothetical protein
MIASRAGKLSNFNSKNRLKNASKYGANCTKGFLGKTGQNSPYFEERKSLKLPDL